MTSRGRNIDNSVTVDCYYSSRRRRRHTLVALGQLIDPPDDRLEDMLVLGESGRDLDETGRQNALRELGQSLEAADAAGPARRRVNRPVFEAPLDAKQVDPGLGERKPDLDVLARGLRGATTTAVVARNHRLYQRHYPSQTVPYAYGTIAAALNW